jgi:hypothetical protein
MRLPTLLIGLLLCVGFSPSASSQTRIEDDMGGSLGKYLLRFAAIRDAGERVIIDGSCFSSCTLVTALIPRERVCITPRAALGFHASWVDGVNGQRLISTAATQVLLEMYPRSIRNWITRNGGLGARTIVLKGSELAAFYRSCE